MNAKELGAGRWAVVFDKGDEAMAELEPHEEAIFCGAGSGRRSRSC